MTRARLAVTFHNACVHESQEGQQVKVYTAKSPSTRPQVIPADGKYHRITAVDPDSGLLVSTYPVPADGEVLLECQISGPVAYPLNRLVVIQWNRIVDGQPDDPTGGNDHVMPQLQDGEKKIKGWNTWRIVVQHLIGGRPNLSVYPAIKVIGSTPVTISTRVVKITSGK